MNRRFLSLARPRICAALVATSLCVACEERPPPAPVPSATARGTASEPTKADKIKGLQHDIALLDKKIARLEKKAARSFAKDQAIKLNKELAVTKKVLAAKKKRLAELRGEPLPASPARSATAAPSASATAAASAARSAGE